MRAGALGEHVIRPLKDRTLRNLTEAQALNQQLQAKNVTLIEELRTKKIKEYRQKFTFANASSGSIPLEGRPKSLRK
ncbi:hypothetical protein R1flu_018981 [Riccia fluitans]|uniref:Uncharacterized protein n=1 Tax=Riccia fluitans TaxID=41844 RepID=A0ABD1ZHJ5_9MARC